MAAQALEQSALEGKDKDQLLQIAKALGVKGVSKLKKADLVDKIIDATGGADDPSPATAPAPARAVDRWRAWIQQAQVIEEWCRSSCQGSPGHRACTSACW
jgi:acetyl-CoA carboxylase alpha subunit